MPSRPSHPVVSSSVRMRFCRVWGWTLLTVRGPFAFARIPHPLWATGLRDLRPARCWSLVGTVSVHVAFGSNPYCGTAGRVGSSALGAPSHSLTPYCPGAVCICMDPPSSVDLGPQRPAPSAVLVMRRGGVGARCVWLESLLRHCGRVGSSALGAPSRSLAQYCPAGS